MQGVFRRARDDTRAAFGFKWGTGARFVPASAAVLLLFYYFRGGTEAMNEGIEIALYVIAFFAAAVVPTFLWNLWLAPYKIVNENISKLETQIATANKILGDFLTETRKDRNEGTKDRVSQNDTAVWQLSPGAGRIAARLIMTVPSIEEAQRIYDGFSAAANKQHEEAANFAFLHRLNDEGYGSEVYALAQELIVKGEEIHLDGDYEQELIRLCEDAKGRRSM